MPTFTIHDNDGAVVVRGHGDGLDLWAALRRHFITRYPSALGVGGLRYPETTNRDVRAVIMGGAWICDGTIECGHDRTNQQGQ